MMVSIKHWFKHTIKTKVNIRVYQVWMIMIIEAIIIIIGARILLLPKKYKVITDDDVRTMAINCYHSKEDLRCYIEKKVKQYGRVR